MNPKCKRCGEEMIDEPHYDCEAELKQIQAQEEAGDREAFYYDY